MEDAVVLAKQAVLPHGGLWGSGHARRWQLDLRKMEIFYPWKFIDTKTDFPDGKTALQ